MTNFDYLKNTKTLVFFIKEYREIAHRWATAMDKKALEPEVADFFARYKISSTEIFTGEGLAYWLAAEHED